MLDYHLMAKVKNEMDQFCEGLNTLGFLKAMRATPNIFNPYLTQIETNLIPSIYTRHILVLLIMYPYTACTRRIVYFFRIHQGACGGEFLPERQFASLAESTGLYLFHRLNSGLVHG